MRKSLFTFVVMLAVLVGCSAPAAAPQQLWTGTTESLGTVQDLLLRYTANPDQSLTGEYRVAGEFAGTFTGTLTGAALTATLQAGNAGTVCSYSFVGTLSAGTISGNFEPDSCPGGAGGSWNLVLSQ